MEYSPRAKQILNVLMQKKEGITEQEIGDSLNLSKRTVQRELKGLETDLQQDHIELKRNRGTGLYLEGKEENLVNLKNQLSNDKELDVTDKEERRKYLLFEMLKDRMPHKLYYFAEQMGVSETTIAGDMEKLTPWLEENHLAIIRKPGYGVVLSGSEKHYREALQRFISETVTTERLNSVLYQKSDAIAKAVQDSTDEGTIYELLNGDVIQRVLNVLNGFDDKRLRQLADNAYVALVMHITIAIQRIMEGEVLESDRRLELSLQQDEDYGLAQQIILQLEKEFNIIIPAVELDYILLHIRGSKLKYSDTPEDMSGFTLSDEEALDLVDQMIDAFGTDYVYELKCDEVLIHGLLVHLQPTLFRLKNDMHIYNPLLEDIQKEYPDIYERCKAVGSLLEKKTGFHINDAEIGYLATHFGAAMVRISKKKTYSRKVSIGIVCASGFGIARLMLTKLSNKLSDSACSLHAFGQEEIGTDAASDVDFYISSMDLSRFGVDFVYVSPLITAKDLAQVQCKVEEYAHIPKSTANSDITHQLDAITSVSQTIKSILHNYRLMQFDEDITFDQMLEQISLHMTLNAKRAHQLHLDLQNREDLASQIIPELGIGLLHCRTTSVNEAAVATAVPFENDRFMNPYFKGIAACVILLIPRDDRTKINADLLGSISSSLASDESFVSLVKQSDEEAVRNRLAEILKNHLSSYVAHLG